MRSDYKIDVDYVVFDIDLQAQIRLNFTIGKTVN